MLLEMKDIVKVYGQVVANDHISFSLDKGEILAVVGENGAGKSTIMKVLLLLWSSPTGTTCDTNRGCKPDYRRRLYQ